MKISIVYIISSIDKALEFEWLVEYLPRDKYDLTFILLNPGKSYLEGFLLEKSIAVHTIRYRGKKDMPVAFLKVFFLLAKISPKIVHAHLFDASLIGLLAAKLAGVPHRIYTRHHSSWHHVYFPHIVKYDRFINSLSTQIVAISEGVRDILIEKEGVSPKKIHLIYHGIDNRLFAERQADLAPHYNPLGKSPVIGVISRYTAWKGIQYIIPAFARLLAQYPNALLMLANAKGDYAHEIKLLLSEIPSENYKEIAFESNIAALYQLFDVFVHVPIDAHSEAFGQIYIEALAAGIPSVFTQSGAALGFAKHLENCYVVPYQSEEAIFEGMKHLLQGNHAAMIENGKRLVAETYHIQTKIAKHEALYAQCQLSPSNT